MGSCIVKYDARRLFQTRTNYSVHTEIEGS